MAQTAAQKEKAAADKAAAEKAAAEKAAAEKAEADKAEADKAAAEKAAAEKAGSQKPASAASAGKPSAPRRVDRSERRWIAVKSDVLHDGEAIKPGEAAPLTRADFDQLKPLGVVDGEWDDGEVVKV